MCEVDQLRRRRRATPSTDRPAKAAKTEGSDATNEKAVTFLQKAIALAPQRTSHHIELGRAYAAMGLNDKARDELERGLALPIQVKDDEEMQRIAKETLAGLPKRTVLAQAKQ